MGQHEGLWRRLLFDENSVSRRVRWGYRLHTHTHLIMLTTHAGAAAAAAAAAAPTIRALMMMRLTSSLAHLLSIFPQPKKSFGFGTETGSEKSSKKSKKKKKAGT